MGDAYDQPVRFGVLGRFSDFFGRMPAMFVIDRHADSPEVVHVHRGSSTFDRSEIDEILAVLTGLSESTPD